MDKTIVTGSNHRGRPRKAWLKYIRNDLKFKGMEASLAQNRTAWKRALNPKSRRGRDNEEVQPSVTVNNAR